MKTKTLSEVTPAEMVFVRRWHETGRKSEALRAAYPHTRRWKGAAVNQRAYELSQKCRPAFEELQEQAKTRCELEVGDMTEDFKRVAFADGMCLFERGADGLPVLKPLEQWTEAERRLVQDFSVESMPDGRTKYKIRFVDKMQAKLALARHIGYFEKDNRQQSSGLKELVAAISDQSMGLPRDRKAANTWKENPDG